MKVTAVAAAAATSAAAAESDTRTSAVAAASTEASLDDPVSVGSKENAPIYAEVDHDKELNRVFSKGKQRRRGEKIPFVHLFFSPRSLNNNLAPASVAVSRRKIKIAPAW